MRYICYLNDKVYGMGSKEYMAELFKDYVVHCEMYGKKEVKFVVKRVTDVEFNKELQAVIEGRNEVRN